MSRREWTIWGHVGDSGQFSPCASKSLADAGARLRRNLLGEVVEVIQVRVIEMPKKKRAATKGRDAKRAVATVGAQRKKQASN